jgi:hypothetical protein
MHTYNVYKLQINKQTFKRIRYLVGMRAIRIPLTVSVMDRTHGLNGQPIFIGGNSLGRCWLRRGAR